MSRANRTTGTADPEAWVIEGLGGRRSPRRKRGARAGKSATDWLSPSTPPDTRQRSGANGGGMRALTKRQVARKLSKAESQIKAYEKRVGELEAQLKDEKKKARAKLATVRSELKTGRQAVPNGKLDANSVTLEQLRTLGLSLTQSVNVIRRREAQDGFRSGAELMKIPGLSKAAREKIHERLRVSRH